MDKIRLRKPSLLASAVHLNMFTQKMPLRKLLDSLTDVLESKDSPMDIKEPIALKFLPSTLLEELHIVKTGQKLAKHQFFHLLMDDPGIECLLYYASSVLC